MSEHRDNVDAQRQALAEEFGQEADPLAKHSDKFDRVSADPFRLYMTDIIGTRDIADQTYDVYELTFRQWQEFMDTTDRHPACPNETHVKQFARYELEHKDNDPATIKEKLRKLDDVYQYWQAEPSFPHPNDYNPFSLARAKLDLTSAGKKDVRRIPLPELRKQVQDVTNIRDRAIIVTQLKLGIRATELSNIRLPELSLANSEVQDHYGQMGTDRMLEGRPNAVFIPSDREGNKSKRPRVLPLDDETRRVLLRYLLIRPDVDDDHLFLSADHHEPIEKQAVIDAWKTYFHPKYAETEQYQSVTSHYGRHYFTTYWTVQKELNRELVKYMRGDVTSRDPSAGPPGAIDTYIHTYYEDIEDTYRDEIYKLNV